MTLCQLLNGVYLKSYAHSWNHYFLFAEIEITLTMLHSF